MIVCMICIIWCAMIDWMICIIWYDWLDDMYHMMCYDTTILPYNTIYWSTVAAVYTQYMHTLDIWCMFEHMCVVHICVLIHACSTTCWICSIYCVYTCVYTTYILRVSGACFEHIDHVTYNTIHRSRDIHIGVLQHTWYITYICIYTTYI